MYKKIKKTVSVLYILYLEIIIEIISLILNIFIYLLELKIKLYILKSVF